MTKSRDKFIKGPLKLQMVLETIEQDKYNRKYRDKKPTSKKHWKQARTNSMHTRNTETENSRDGQDEIIKQKLLILRQTKLVTGTYMPGTASTMQQLQKMGHFAKVCKSKAVNRIQEKQTADSHTESWPEIDHIQSVNSYNRVNFYKVILLVQGQPIDFFIDIGSPVTKIPPIINPIEVKKTTKCFVDVNKNSIKFKGEAMVERKTEKSKEVLSKLVTENKNTQPLLGLNWLDKLEIEFQETETRTFSDTLKPMKNGRRLSTNTKIYSKRITQSNT